MPTLGHDHRHRHERGLFRGLWHDHAHRHPQPRRHPSPRTSWGAGRRPAEGPHAHGHRSA